MHKPKNITTTCKETIGHVFLVELEQCCLSVREIPLPSGSSRSGVTVAVMSGQTAYAEITRAPEEARKPSLPKKLIQTRTCKTHTGRDYLEL